MYSSDAVIMYWRSYLFFKFSLF